jgi:hypothetical protein
MLVAVGVAAGTVALFVLPEVGATAQASAGGRDCPALIAATFVQRPRIRRASACVAKMPELSFSP